LGTPSFQDWSERNSWLRTHGRDAADGRVQPPVVIPVDVGFGGQLDNSEAVSRPAGFDQLGFVQLDGGFHQDGVVRPPTEASSPA